MDPPVERTKGNQISARQGTPTDSQRSATALKAENIVIEYKCARDGLGDKELRKQIADDFLLYGKHVDCKKLVVFVYDSNQHVPNPEGFENDLTVKVEGLDSVHIIIRR
ncbi:hypothetical protein [Methylorubrum populi]|uniref:PD-(D/E)XK nuclease domain-containing protein n=1 Tax=Methylorubrum populi TaxID=223967 RepID=UPI00130189F9